MRAYHVNKWGGTLRPWRWAAAYLALGTLVVAATTWNGLAATNLIAPSNADRVDLAVTPPIAPPGPPSIISVTPASRALVVRWSPPTNIGGGPIISYRAVADPGGAWCEVAAPATTCTITGLNNGQRFTVTVQAANAGGYGPASTPSAPVRPRP